VIWNHTEAPQQGLKSIRDPSPENMHSEFIDSYIFRHCGESNHTKAAELITKPAWVCATDAASVTELADRGMIIHQQFPLFIAYWSVPESADSRFIMHTRLGLCITLPIPLDAMGEESLNIQQNRYIWLEEALAFVAVKKRKCVQLCLDDSAEDADEDACLDESAISYPAPMDYSNSPFKMMKTDQTIIPECSIKTCTPFLIG